MGEAKRRRGFDPNYGKISKHQPRFLVVGHKEFPTDKVNITLLSGVEETKKDNVYTLEIQTREKVYECLFLITGKFYRRKPKLYAHLISSPISPNSIIIGSQIDEVSPIVCKYALENIIKVLIIDDRTYLHPSVAKELGKLDAQVVD